MSPAELRELLHEVNTALYPQQQDFAIRRLLGALTAEVIHLKETQP
jgi:hypothetical protein